MTALAHIVTGFPHQRVLGQAGMLDTARFTHFVAEELRRSGRVGHDADARLPWRHHGAGGIGVLEWTTSRPDRRGAPAEKVDELVERTRNGGAEIVGLLKTGSAYYAPSAAAAGWLARCMKDSGAVMPVCAWVDGEYGLSGVPESKQSSARCAQGNWKLP